MKLSKMLLIQPKGLVSEGFGSAVEDDRSATSNEDDSRGMRWSGTAALNRASRELGFKAPFAPISLTSVAALTPPDIAVEIWDEHTQPPVDASVAERGYDLVGVTGFHLHRPRALKIAEVFRDRGIPVVVGGPGVSSEPDAYRNAFDHLFIGEVELTWPKFIQDYRAGQADKEYRQIEKPELDGIPVPRWDLVPRVAKDYILTPVQTTRGCPFDCEFCDVIHLFGRRSRHKPIARVLEEIARIERMGVRRVFFSDDNFIGHTNYAKDLLRQLIKLNNSFRRPLTFGTSLTMNVARDDELLELLADANFVKLLIGIESANPESLKETNKPQNYKSDLMADIHKIHSYGMAIHGQLILGFDHDTPDIFERTFEFAQQSCIPTIIVNPLYALPGTKLWHRLRREGRILDTEHPEHFSFRTNIAYKNLSRPELYRGYVDLYQRLYEPGNLEARMAGMISQIKRTARFKQTPLRILLREEGWQRVTGVFRYAKRPDLRAAIRKTLFQTWRHARFALQKIVGLWANALMMKQFTDSMRPGIEAIIDYEERHPPQPLRDEAIILTPALRKDYKDIFPSIYRRLASRLHDQAYLNQALVEVVAEFLERFHTEYDRLGGQRFMQLQEICDRTLARLNDEDPTTTRFPDAPPIESFSMIRDRKAQQLIKEIRRVKLDDDIFEAVELELRRASAGAGFDHADRSQPKLVPPLAELPRVVSA